MDGLDLKKLKYDKLLFPDKRPKCPRCGSLHIISRGIEWGCGKCGRRWIKETNWGKEYEKTEKEVDKEAVRRENKGNQESVKL